MTSALLPSTFRTRSARILREGANEGGRAVKFVNFRGLGARK
jgi:hypothetical protein